VAFKTWLVKLNMNQKVVVVAVVAAAAGVQKADDLFCNGRTNQKPIQLPLACLNCQLKK